MDARSLREKTSRPFPEIIRPAYLFRVSIIGVLVLLGCDDNRTTDPARFASPRQTVLSVVGDPSTWDYFSSDIVNRVRVLGSNASHSDSSETRLHLERHRGSDGEWRSTVQLQQPAVPGQNPRSQPYLARQLETDERGSYMRVLDASGRSMRLPTNGIRGIPADAVSESRRKLGLSRFETGLMTSFRVKKRPWFEGLVIDRSKQASTGTPFGAAIKSSNENGSSRVVRSSATLR